MARGRCNAYRAVHRAEGGGVSVRVTDTERRAFFTPKTLAAYLAVSERTVRSMLKARKIASYRVEGARRIDPADVDHYLANRREEKVT
jgi:excisionase family DNA binding protein